MLSYEVVERYLFVAPTRWAAVLSQLTLIYGTLVSLPWLLQNRRHIQINAVTARLSNLHRHIVGVAMIAVLIVLVAI